MIGTIKRSKDAWLSIPSSSPESAPHQTKEKRTAPLALSPRSQCLSMSLTRSPLLCAQVWALTHQLQQQLLTGNKRRKSLQVRKQRQQTTHLRTLCSARVAVRREKSLRGHIQLCVVESPFVYTCDRWMGLLLAAPSSFRSPKSPALSKSNNYAHKRMGDRSLRRFTAKKCLR